MKVETKYLGEQEIEEDMIIHFSSGIPGFHDEKRFVILDIPANDILQIMQSVNDPNLALFVTNPHYFYNDYVFSLDDNVVNALEIKDEKDIVILAIMTVQEPFENSTINLKAPVIINSKNKYGKQYILNDEKFSMKARISLPVQEGGE